VHVATTLLFDIGVYMVVAGSAVLMLIALAHQSMRSPKRVSLIHKDEVVNLQDGKAGLRDSEVEH
jgi:multicomponent K+:H+ antiporter subunit A